MRALNAGLAFAFALIEELARSGVRHAVVSPGSRSAPLALAVDDHAQISDHSILDERSAGFFALGLARATRAPVALICTSGTAAANYLPAVVEAHHSRVPLLVLTADRPPELRDCGAGQTVDQLKLYGGHVRFFAELPTPAADGFLLRSVRAVGCRAVQASRAPDAGPVHLNLPLREPLAPIAVESEREALAALDPLAREGRAEVGAPLTRVHESAARGVPASRLGELVDRLGHEPHGWLVAGPLDATPELACALARLAARLGWPVLAEPLSQLRSGEHERGSLVDAHDALLRAHEFCDANKPRLVLRFGSMPTSKAYRLFLERHPEIGQIVVDPEGWCDPSALATDIVRADPLELARALYARLPASASKSGFAARWVEAGALARRALDTRLDREPRLSEPGTIREVAHALPAGAQVFLASSMPVRDADLFWPSDARPLRFVANRGANGIDGTLSCALGHAAGTVGPTVLLTGDLALLHDVSGLVYAKRSGLDLIVVVLDNDGGGIFEMLPLADATDRDSFERHFGTPHGLDLADVVRGFGLTCSEVADGKDLRASLNHALEHGGVELIVVRTRRTENADLHRSLHEEVHKALEAEWPS